MAVVSFSPRLGCGQNPVARGGRESQSLGSGRKTRRQNRPGRVLERL